MLRSLTAMFGLLALVSCGQPAASAAPSRSAPAATHAHEPAARVASPAHATGHARGTRKAAPARTSPAVPSAAPAATVSKSGIVPTGTNAWNVPKSLVTKYTNNPNALGSQASVAQVDKGWRIKSVKSGSDVSSMGVKTGDVVTQVNGYSVDGTLNTWWAAQHLKNQSSYRVSILRAGKPMLLKYKVVQ